MQRINEQLFIERLLIYYARPSGNHPPHIFDRLNKRTNQGRSRASVSIIKKKIHLSCRGLAGPIPVPPLAAVSSSNTSAIKYPQTISVLQRAWRAERIAAQQQHWLQGKSPAGKIFQYRLPVPCLFFSEEIHAENYRDILTNLGQKTVTNPLAVTISDTRSNLKTAAAKELGKKSNPFIHLFCRNWTRNHAKSHYLSACILGNPSSRGEGPSAMHYSALFFGSVTGELEGLPLDFHMCRICGSTIDEKSYSPCTICKRSKSNYNRILRPI